MPGPLKNSRHERFAQARAKGLSVDAAFAAAGYKANSGNAARMNGIESVRSRLAELQSRAAAKVETTVADIARQLDEDRDFAKSINQAGPMVSASLGKAKVLGLVVDRQELTGKGGGPIEYRNLDEDEIDARLDALKDRNVGHAPLAH